MINRAEQVVCEVDLRQYQQMQQQAAAAHQVVQQQQQPQHSEDHLRTAVSVSFPSAVFVLLVWF